MPYCEMCGAEQESLTTIMVSHAELEVCDDCEDLGTTISTESDTSASKTKYSTDTPSSGNGNDSGSSHSPSTPSIDTSVLRPDYGSVIRDARDSKALTMAELAEEVGEKESHVRKIEAGERRPTEQLQERLESALDIDLTAEEVDVDGFSGDGTGQTLGDVAEFNSE